MGNKKSQLNKKMQDEMVQTSSTLMKNYHFQKKNIGLDFSLNVGSREDMEIFIELMANATTEIAKDIEKLNQ